MVLNLVLLPYSTSLLTRVTALIKLVFILVLLHKLHLTKLIILLHLHGLYLLVDGLLVLHLLVDRILHRYVIIHHALIIHPVLHNLAGNDNLHLTHLVHLLNAHLELTHLVIVHHIAHLHLGHALRAHCRCHRDGYMIHHLILCCLGHHPHARHARHALLPHTVGIQG